MPQAIITTTSRSLDRRPNATRIPINSAIGIVKASDIGTSVRINRRIVVHGTPFAIIASARSMMKGIIRMKVNTRSAMTNGGMISRMMYRSRVRIGWSVHYRRW